MEVQRTLQQWSLENARIRWGAVFAGLFVGLAVQMLLTLLGLAVGAWSIDLHDAEPVKGIPLGTGIWTGVSMLISAFIGGYVTARLSGAYLRSDGLFHGAVVWGLTWVIFAWLATTAMSFMVGGLFNAFGATLKTLGQGMSAATDKVSGNAGIDLSAKDLRRQIESVLQATGKKELQPTEIKKDANKITDQVQGGRPLSEVTDSVLAEVQEKLASFDRQAAVNVMVNKLGMTETQAREVVKSTLGITGPIKRNIQNVKEQSVNLGNAAIDRIGSAAWWLFVGAVLSLAASLGGGALGIRLQEPMLQVEAESYQSEFRRTAT